MMVWLGKKELSPGYTWWVLNKVGHGGSRSAVVASSVHLLTLPFLFAHFFSLPTFPDAPFLSFSSAPHLTCVAYLLPHTPHPSLVFVEMSGISSVFFENHCQKIF